MVPVPAGQAFLLNELGNSRLVLGFWAQGWALKSEACQLDTSLSSQAFPLLEKVTVSSMQLAFIDFFFALFILTVLETESH